MVVIEQLKTDHGAVDQGGLGRLGFIVVADDAAATGLTTGCGSGPEHVDGGLVVSSVSNGQAIDKAQGGRFDGGCIHSRGQDLEAGLNNQGSQGHSLLSESVEMNDSGTALTGHVLQMIENQSVNYDAFLFQSGARTH